MDDQTRRGMYYFVAEKEKWGGGAMGTIPKIADKLGEYRDLKIKIKKL